VRPREDPTKLGAAAGPSGPRAAAMRPRNAIRRGPSRPRRSEVFDMATMTKVRKKLERVSVLNGWRMRWYMQ